MGGWRDVVVIGLRGLSPSTAALGAIFHVIEMPILGGLVDLSHLKDRQGDQGTHKLLLSPSPDAPILLCIKWSGC